MLLNLKAWPDGSAGGHNVVWPVVSADYYKPEHDWTISHHLADFRAGRLWKSTFECQYRSVRAELLIT